MKTKFTDESRHQLLKKLKHQSRTPGGRIWRRLYEELQASRRNRLTVNVGELQQHHVRGQILVVPGKVLSEGVIEDKLQVAAYSFSSQAREKIQAKGGKCLSLEELIEENPTGTKVRLIA
ncbi:MAG: 50S ribosomal protein L18e [Candidatus Hermodarchaeota archaeon]|jgi:large subunit ribosomal protein L18e|nr:50S ribosomal protein L18e [Candidatus Hermodarchaeota archaeon]